MAASTAATTASVTTAIVAATPCFGVAHRNHGRDHISAKPDRGQRLQYVTPGRLMIAHRRFS
jgi:hypothetical protein